MFTSQHKFLSSAAVGIRTVVQCVAWKVITALRALVNIGWILTLSHGLEVQFATVASKTSYGSGPDLEHVYTSWLETTDDHCVSLAPDGGGIIFRLILGKEKQRVTWVCINNYSPAAETNNYGYQSVGKLCWNVQLDSAKLQQKQNKEEVG